MANASFPPVLENTVDNEFDLDSSVLGELHQSPILVLSRYSALIDTVRKAAPRGVPVVQAPDLDHVTVRMRSLRPGVLVVDTASTTDLATMVAQLTAHLPTLVIVAAGQRDDSAALTQLAAAGQIFRFLLVPLSHGQTRLTLEAAIAEHKGLSGAAPQMDELKGPDEGAKKRDLSGYIAFAIGVAISIWGIWWFALRAPAEAEAPTTAVTVTPASPRTTVASQPDRLQAELARAQAAFARGEYAEPAGESALDYYRSASNIDPESLAAQAGIRSVASKMLERAESALRAKKLEDAVAAIDAARDIDPQLPRLAFLDAQVASERSKQSQAQDLSRRVATLVAGAQGMTSQGRLVTPQGGNARDTLLEARRLDPNNAAVLQGLRDLTQALAEEANRKIRSGNLEEAQALLASARQLGADTVALSTVEGALINARNAVAASPSPRPAPLVKPSPPAPVANPTKDAPKAVIADGGRTPVERKPADSKPTDPGPETAKNASATLRPANPSREEINEPTPPAKVPESPQQPLAAARDAVAPANDAAARPTEPTAARTNTTGGASDIVPASTLRRIRTVEPEYPVAARRRKEKGMVELVFTVTPDGSVENVEVRRSMPEQVFDDAAKKAVEQWRFEPVKVDGQAVSQRASARLRFSMD